jgi:aspartyl-tRNA(Asn)/glutamyl-tRNA(Gln) amidotransferase subunit A
MQSVVECVEAVRSGERSAKDVLEDCITRIEAGNEVLNAFVYTDFDSARSSADEIDAVVARGDDPGPLAGVPFGIKDLEDCAGMPTSHGSLLYKDRGPVPADSIHVARLRAAGAIPVGKTAAPEFGTLHFTKTKAWGVTRNPWNTERTPGGSSGGSAAAVAAGMLPFSTASDGGGSTRIPAAFTGLVGMKPSFGRIPSPHQDDSLTAVPGAEVTTVRDAARHLDVARGPADADKFSLPATDVSYEDAIESLDVSGLGVLWSPDLGFARGVDPEVVELSAAAAETLIDAAGLERVDVELAFTDPVKVWLSSGGLGLWLGIQRHEHWPGRADDLTFYVRSALDATVDRPLPTMDSVYRRRWQLEEECAALFEQIDVLLCPTTAVVAFDATGPTARTIDGIELGMGMEVPFTMLANLCWNPACSVPAGLNSEDLPVGLQIIGPRHRDDIVLRLARIFEQARPWPRHAPAL